MKRFGKQHGRNMKATWTQHESNMHNSLRKHQVLETFWEATRTQHESNMHKNLRKHQVFETFWEAT